MDNYQTVIDSTAKAYDSHNSAIVENEKQIDSINGRVKIFKTNIEQLYATIISSDALKKLVSTGTSLVETFNMLITSSKGSGVALLIMGISILAITKNSVGLVKAIMDVSKTGKSLMAMDVIFKALTGSTLTFAGATSSLKGALSALFLTPAGLLFLGIASAIGVATYNIVKHVQHQKELKAQLDKNTESYKTLSSAISEFNLEAQKSNSEGLESQQKKLQDMITLMNDFRDNQSKYNTYNNPTAGRDMYETQKKKVEDYIKQIELAGFSVNRLTGEIQELNVAQSNSAIDDNIKKIKEETDAQIKQNEATTSLIERYQALASTKNRTAEQEKEMSTIAKQLGNDIKGLIVVTDAHGNAIVQNAGLLQTQKDALGDLSEASRTSANQQINDQMKLMQVIVQGTSITIGEIEKRIEAYRALLDASLAGESLLDDNKTSKILANIERYQKVIDSAKTKINSVKYGYSNPKISTSSYMPPAKSDSKSGDTVDNLDLELDRYSQLNGVLSQINAQLDINNKLQEKATGQNKIDLMNEEIKLLDKKKLALKAIADEQIRELAEQKSKLANQGFTFDTSGQLTNQNQKLQDLATKANNIKSAEAKKKAIEDIKDIEEEVKRYNELINTSIPESNSQWQDLVNTLENVQETIRKIKFDSVLDSYSDTIDDLNDQISDIDLKGLIGNNNNAELNSYAEKYKVIQQQIRETLKYLNDLSAMEAKTDEERKAIADAQEKASDDLRDLQAEAVRTYQSAQQKMTDILKEQVEKRKKAIEDEYNKQVEMLNKAKDLYNSQNSETDSANEIAKERQKLTELRAEYTKASRDMSDSGKARLETLKKEIQVQEETINNLITKAERERQNNLFDDRIDYIEDLKQKQIDALEAEFSDENIARIIAQALSKDFFTDVSSQISGVNSTYQSWVSNLNSGLTTAGNTLQTNFIDKLQEARSLMTDLSSLSLNTASLSMSNFLPSISVPSLTMPTLSTLNKPSINVDRLVDIHIDNISDLSDTAFIKKINELKDVVGEAVESVFMDKAYR